MRVKYIPSYRNSLFITSIHRKCVYPIPKLTIKPPSSLSTHSKWVRLFSRIQMHRLPHSCVFFSHSMPCVNPSVSVCTSLSSYFFISSHPFCFWESQSSNKGFTLSGQSAMQAARVLKPKSWSCTAIFSQYPRFPTFHGIGPKFKWRLLQTTDLPPPFLNLSRKPSNHHRQSHWSKS